MNCSHGRCRSVSWLVIALSCGPGYTSWAQQGNTTKPYSIEQTVRRVVEDVIVSDPQGRTVAGLKRRDFSVREDGVPQRILSFEAHDLSPAKAATAPANLAPDSFINLPSQQERGPLYVLVYDMIHIGSEDGALDQQMYARQQLTRFVKSKPEGTRFAIYAMSDGIHLMQGFTADRDLLLKALDPSGRTPHMPRAFLYAGIYYWDNPQAKALLEIANYVAGLPGRKNVIWMANGFRLPLFPSLGTPDQQRAAEQLLNELADEQIAIYPVDTACVAGGLGKMTEYQLEDEIAERTGGRAFYSSNDLVDLLNKATAAGAVYYTLSYRPEYPGEDGHFRKVEIRLAKKGYKLTYRPGYYAISRKQADESNAAQQYAANGAESNPDDLYVWVRHGMPISHDVVFQATLKRTGPARVATGAEMAELAQYPAYFRTRKKARAAATINPVSLRPYEIDYAMTTRQFRLQPGMKHADQDTLEFAAAAYDREGALLNGTIDHAISTRKASTGSYYAVQTFDVPANAASICLVVRDVDTGRIGNVEIPLPLKSENTAKEAGY